METLTTNKQSDTKGTGERLTNKLRLPSPIVKAVMNDPYDNRKSDFTPSILLTPPRARALINQHRNEITEDVSDKLWALMGQIGHTILERAGDKNIIERRFFAKVASFMVSGQADLILQPQSISDAMHSEEINAELVDYKFCSVWTAKEGVKTEWTQQLNILKYLASEDENPVTINKANIIAIFRDWSKPKARREKDYPQSQVQVMPVELWSLEKTEAFICERIAAHISAETTLPLCTDEERWHTPDKWAVLKKGNKRAHRLLDNEQQANAMATQEKMVVEFRLGESKRCADYCKAFPFCTQAQSENQTTNGQNP